jgi:hypothetical protein
MGVDFHIEPAIAGNANRSNLEIRSTVHSWIFSNKQLKYHTQPSTMMSNPNPTCPWSTAFVASHPEAQHSVCLASLAKNVNGVPYGESDPKIKCAFFRAFNPRTEKYMGFRVDVDKAGLDPDMIDDSGWPMIFIQQGARKSLLEGAGLDTSDLDGYLDGLLSHQDLMWPHRAEIAALLEKKQDASGIITVAPYSCRRMSTACVFRRLSCDFHLTSDTTRRPL